MPSTNGRTRYGRTCTSPGPNRLRVAARSRYRLRIRAKGENGACGRSLSHSAHSAHAGDAGTAFPPRPTPARGRETGRNSRSWRRLAPDHARIPMPARWPNGVCPPANFAFVSSFLEDPKSVVEGKGVSGHVE